MLGTDEYNFINNVAHTYCNQMCGHVVYDSRKT